MSTKSGGKEEPAPDEKDWQYPAYGDIDVRGPYHGCRIDSDDIDVSMAPPKPNEVTVIMTMHVDDKEEIAGSLLNFAASDAADFGRDVILTAAGAAQEAMTRAAGDAVLEQTIADLEAELERDDDE